MVGTQLRQSALPKYKEHSVKADASVTTEEAFPPAKVHTVFSRQTLEFSTRVL